ncbi:MAG: hypothetical protein IJU68_07980 [Bacteroidales bacterium]|nr:hypothetical protein [Bacteroidales bacterium]
MKTTSVTLFCAIACIGLALSCNSTIDIVQAPAEKEMTFTCELKPDSRLGIDAQGKTSWEAGDQILFHGKWTGKDGSTYYSRTVTLTAENISADKKTASVTLETFNKGTTSGDEGSDVYALYPASAVAVDNGHSNWRRLHTFNESNLPLMVGYNKETDGTTFEFMNVCALVSFSVSGDYDTYEFSGNSGETVGYSGYQAEVYWTTGGSRSANLNKGGTPLTTVSGTVNANGTAVNYVCIPAGADFSAGFTIKLLKGGVVQKRARTSSAVNLSAGDLLGLGNITSHLQDPPAPSLCRSEYLGQTPAVIAYLTEYTDKNDLAATSYVTHINFCHGRFGNPTTGDGGIVINGGSYTDLRDAVLALKSSRPELKVLLMIGGYGERADGFSQMARSAAKRTAFCQACKSHIDTYGFDGIDIDWEYPTVAARGNGASAADALNFNAVLRELRETIGNTKIISVASYAEATYIDWSEAINYVDYVNDMTYDMGSVPKHNSPLYRSSTFNHLSCHESVEAHKAKGIPASRIVLGVPFYGHGKTPYASDVKFNEMASILGSGLYGSVDVTGKNIRRWDDTAKVPYLVDSSDNILLCYDDAESVAAKGEYARNNGLFGAMIWEYRHDDAGHTLLQALSAAVRP